MSGEQNPYCGLLIEIVQRARTIVERLQDGPPRPKVELDVALVQQRLDTWCQVVAKGDWAAFQKRLAWDGLDLETARGALAPMHLDNGSPLPEWADLLDNALRLAGRSHDAGAGSHLSDLKRLQDPEQPLPFEEILAPFVLVARRRLASRVGTAYNLLTAEAHVTLERDLLTTLASCGSGALYLEFSLLRVQEQSTLDRLAAAACDDNDNSLYQQFIQELRGGGLASFFREYAVLARLISTVTGLWVEANAEFIERLASDWQDLEHMFSRVGELGPVVTVEPSLSDPHRGRRSVIAVSFASGCRIVYKPKDLGVEAAYNRLLHWLNERGAPLPFKVLGVLKHSDINNCA
jgi:hypothetical protein